MSSMISNSIRRVMSVMDLPLPLLICLVQYILVSVVIAQDHPLPYPPPFETVVINPLPHTYILEHQLPLNFTWQNVNGYSYLTRLRNQHIPQYCKFVWLVVHIVTATTIYQLFLAQEHMIFFCFT